MSDSADEFHTSVTLDAIHNCSKFESRLLADAISEKLPREIRDMIHSLCWEEQLAQYDLGVPQTSPRMNSMDLKPSAQSIAAHLTLALKH
jgi:hypothetical protein